MEARETPASVSQRLLWMIKHYRSDFGALNCPVVCRIVGDLDGPALQAAVDALVARHEALRTTFHGRGARLVQRVHPPRPQPLVWADLATGESPQVALARDLQTPIDPGQWPTRASVWRVGATEHLFCLNLHHLVTDAWSTGILLRDLVACYDAACGGAAVPAPQGWQMSRFAQAQQELLASDRLGRYQRYWRQQLAGSQIPRLDALYPAADADGTGADADGTGAAAPRSVAAELPAATVAGLRELARREKTTMFTVLLAAFHTQLHRLTGQPDLAVASMFANRSRPEVRDTVGLLAGMVLLRAQVARQNSFAELVRHLHAAVISAFAYQDLPFHLLPTGLVDTGGGRADDVMFNVMSPLRHDLTGGGARFELVVPTEIGSRFPFELALAPVGEHRVQAVLFRAGGWADPALGQEFLAGYLEVAAAAAHRPDARLPARG
ncbi:condensation domain-containing protein [Micromonospora sp. WMMD714]|uniref:condensation domain-containing protein n=1 Tax=Micromonospora sp. WMMD714 TaxID=3016097 RepID=UPI002499D530|nr:condensation domain-containing protein [Micromonospora sp. WMMD714]WFE65077.1 condensation domain-containing protein [Micromonospora sp. WMMD714]